MAINSSQLPGPITGVNQLAYTGSVPNMILMNRRPTTEDLQLFVLGFWWIIPVTEDYPTGEVWVLTSKADGIATWKRLGGGAASGVETLTGNTGGPVDPLDGNINVVGSGSVVVTGNPSTNTLTITTSGGGGGVIGVNKIYYTTPGSGTYNAPSNLVTLYVECVGGGGGSAGTGGAYSADPGAGGGYCAKTYTAAQIGASQPYTVGGGGSGGASGDSGGGQPGAGGNGGNSTFGAGITLITANGGEGGPSLNSFPPGQARGAIGGSASGGDINIKGGDASFGATTGNNVWIASQVSGGSVLGMPTTIGLNPGGDGTFWYASGGNQYGGGAASAFSTNSSYYQAGAAGASGIVILTEYLS